jgi:hypothetical protein
MSKFIGYIASLVLIFVLLNVIFVRVFTSLDWNLKKAKESAGFKEKRFEIAVLGNSTVLDGVNAKMISEHLGEAYNFALGGATVRTNRLQFEKYLEANHKPKLVLVGLSSCLNRQYPKNPSIHPAASFFYGFDDNISLSNVPIYKLRWAFIEGIKKFISSDHREARLVKGQLQLNRSIPDKTLFTPEKATDEFDEHFYSQVGLNDLWSIVRLCKKNNIKILVCEMPCGNSRQNNEDAGARIIRNGRDSSENFILLNMNSHQLLDSIINPETDWLSKDHLNLNGAISFTNSLLENIRKLEIDLD